MVDNLIRGFNPKEPEGAHTQSTSSITSTRVNFSKQKPGE
jgi:hypothetical protein